MKHYLRIEMISSPAPKIRNCTPPMIHVPVAAQSVSPSLLIAPRSASCAALQDSPTNPIAINNPARFRRMSAVEAARTDRPNSTRYAKKTTTSSVDIAVAVSGFRDSRSMYGQLISQSILIGSHV